MSKCKYCDIVSDFLLYTVSNGKEEVSVCPNHSATENFIIDEMESSSEHECILCGSNGYNFKSSDFKTNLCKDHIYKMIDVSFTPEEYFKVREATTVGTSANTIYLLHDDFYCEESGVALQPSDRVRERKSVIYVITELYNLSDPGLRVSSNTQLFFNKEDAETTMTDMIFKIESEFRILGYEINSIHEKTIDGEFYEIMDIDGSVYSEIKLQPLEVN